MWYSFSLLQHDKNSTAGSYGGSSSSLADELLEITIVSDFLMAIMLLTLVLLEHGCYLCLYCCLFCRRFQDGGNLMDGHEYFRTRRGNGSEGGLQRRGTQVIDEWSQLLRPNGLSSSEREAMLDQVLPRRVLNADDVRELRDGYKDYVSFDECSTDVEGEEEKVDEDYHDVESPKWPPPRKNKKYRDSSGSPVCSICLGELCEGETVFEGAHCDHLFHRDCIMEWMLCSSSNNAHSDTRRVQNTGAGLCPNCRADLISQVEIDRMYEQRQRRRRQRHYGTISSSSESV